MTASIRRTSSRPIARTLLYVFLLLMAAVSAAPVLIVLITSLKSNAELTANPLGLPQSWQFSNFAEAWQQAHIGQFAMNSILVTVPTLVLVLICSSLAGYAFACLSFPGKTVLFIILLVGLMIPAVSVVTSLSFIEQSLGLFDTLLGLALAETALCMPLAVFIARTGFQDLPPAMREAALVDGGNEFTVYFRVMLPLARPALSAVGVFTFLSTWNDYLLPLVLINTGSKRTIPLGLAFLQSSYTSNVVLIAAATILSALPSVLIYILLQRQFIDGVAQGSVK